jgi:NAD-dependent deacetylase
MTVDPRELERAAAMLREARHAIAFTGAGISTPSGIPDFRSQGSGLWERDNPMEVASLRIFQTRPERFFQWLHPLLGSIWAAQPNPAHLALARLEAAGLLKAVITQNIDDLHQRAGSRAVYEVHGSLRTMTCSRCRQSYPSEGFAAALAARPAVSSEALPRCPGCQQVLKPDITLFGEMLPMQTWEQAERHCRQADALLVAGSSLEVWPAAALPELAIESGARLLINNYSATHLDRQADALLRGDVAEVLPALAELLLGQPDEPPGVM